MLSTEDNELLTRTGPGTPMGNLFRRFWLPALLPRELPNPDSDPIRFRMLGEDLIAFRDTSGRVGFIQNNCPHRGASLFFGRNEENGLRCVYHGWKFDVTGQCVDMPNEPAESNFKTKVRARAYPSAEYAGLVWIYMGPADKQPELPQYEWCMQSNADQSLTRKWLQDSNYSQGHEGQLDSAHIAFLHGGRPPGAPARPGRGAGYNAPQLTVRETDFGFVYGARRPAEGGNYYWRVTANVLPTVSEIPSAFVRGSATFILPRDDEHSWWFYVTPPPAAGEEANLKDERLTPGDASPTETGGFLDDKSFRRARNRDNDYLVDRAVQRTTNYTGLPGNRVQDAMVTESMGAIYDRGHERLGTTDMAIIFWRRQLIRLARDLDRGIEPPVLTHPDWFRVQPIDIVHAEPSFERLWDARETLVDARKA
jgi:phenylpropionate dioxygenase-like ring-hydroxylating dioxygenase large terminal subunit